MKHLLLPAGLFITLQFSFGQVNIDTCQSRARANYPLIKQFDLISKSTEYTVANANRAYLPHVSLTGIGGYIISGLPSFPPPGQPAPEPDKVQMIGIGQISQTIWDGGTTRSAKQVAEVNAEVEKAGIDVSFYSIRERVNQVFFGVLVIDEQLKQLALLKENLDRSYEKVKLSNENGLAYQSDIDEVRAEILNLEQRVIEFNYSRKGYLEMLSLLTGEKLDGNTQLKKPDMPGPLETFTDNRPELTLYSKQLELIEAQSSGIRANSMPKIGLIGAGVFMQPGANFGTAKLNNLAIAGLSLSWNTGGLYRNSNNVKLNKIRAERLINQKEAFSFTNRLQLTQTAMEIEKQKAIIRQDEEIVRLKGDIRKSYQLRFDNGMCSMNAPISCLKSAIVRCVSDPWPAEP